MYVPQLEILLILMLWLGLYSVNTTSSIILFSHKMLTPTHYIVLEVNFRVQLHIVPIHRINNTRQV